LASLFTSNDLKVIEELRKLLPNYNDEMIMDFLVAFHTYTALCYMEGEEVHFPLFGKFLIKYQGDEETSEGRKAKVSGFFSLHEELIRQVGQIEDAKRSGDVADYTKINVVSLYLENKLKKALEEKD